MEYSYSEFGLNAIDFIISLSWQVNLPFLNCKKKNYIGWGFNILLDFALEVFLI